MLITKCRCSRQDNDGQCHWRLGDDYIDRDFSPKTFSKWNCGEVQTTVAPTTTKPAMMPNDLVCPESAVNGNRKVKDFHKAWSFFLLPSTKRLSPRQKGMMKTNHEKYEILLKSVLLMLIESLVECKSTKTHGPGLHVYASLQIRVLCSAVER